MITDASRSYRASAQYGDNATRPLPRVARGIVRPVVVSHIVPAVMARRAARTREESLRMAVWLALFALLNAADLISTYAGLHSGMREGNPLMSGLLGHYGFTALIGYKLVVIGAVSVGVFVLRGFSKGIAAATIWVCNALVCAVVVMNVVQFVTR